MQIKIKTECDISASKALELADGCIDKHIGKQNVPCIFSASSGHVVVTRKTKTGYTVEISGGFR